MAVGDVYACERKSLGWLRSGLCIVMELLPRLPALSAPALLGVWDLGVRQWGSGGE